MAAEPPRPRGGTPPGVRSHVAAMRLARILALVAIAVAAVLALAGCAGGGAPGAPAEPGAGGSGPAESGAAADPHAGVETQEPAEADADEGPADAASARAVAAGIERAASYGFDLSQPAGEEQLEALRSAPADALEGVVVIPSTCETVLRDLNWSPVLLGADSARTDFATEKVSATGSVEVAAIGDRAELDAHYATVGKMLGECNGMTLNMQTDGANGGVVTETVPLASTVPDVADGTADSALLWTRGRADSDLRQQALVLMRESKGHVAMVSFIAVEGLEAQEFADMASAVLEAAVAELPE